MCRRRSPTPPRRWGRSVPSRGSLEEIGGLGDLDTRFPDDWSDAETLDGDGSINPQLERWRAEQRRRAESTVELHQAVAESIESTRDRVADYVEASNAAPGQLAAQQATNELIAVQVQQLQELQALEVAALRAEIERHAAASSRAQWEAAYLDAQRTEAQAEITRLEAQQR